MIKSALGNGVGVYFKENAGALYRECYGDLIVALKDETALCGCVEKRFRDKMKSDFRLSGLSSSL